MKMRETDCFNYFGYSHSTLTSTKDRGRSARNTVLIQELLFHTHEQVMQHPLCWVVSTVLRINGIGRQGLEYSRIHIHYRVCT